MRILVISRNAWDDTNAIGNTMSNFFGGIDNVVFASLYFRSAPPNNRLCKRYYRVSEAEILKKWFCPEKMGRQFYSENNSYQEAQTGTAKREQSLIRLIQRYGLNFAYQISNSLWYSKKWINGNLRDFITDFAPDLIFTFVKSTPQYYLAVRYLRETFNIPLISWIADDEYTGLLKRHSEREIHNLRYILDESAVVRGCSQEICDYYNSVFHCNATTLYKGCDFIAPVKRTVGRPLTMVYAGNLLYGRLEIIKKLSEALEASSSGVQNVSFEVYSNTALGPQEQEYFAQKRCTKYMGRKDYVFIRQRLSEADIAVFAESFEQEQIEKTRYSFSTKIMDYLSCGSAILAIGPGEISSMRHMKRVPGVYVIDNLNHFQDQIAEIFSDSFDILGRAEKIRAYAEQCHDDAATIKNINEMIRIAMVVEDR